MKQVAQILAIGIAQLLAVAAPRTALATAEEREILKQVQGFYGWVLQHGDTVQRLQPVVRQVPASNRLWMDVSTLPEFKAGFMNSGYFSADFPRAVDRYFAKERRRLDALSPSDLSDMAQNGRGPLLATEDMDIFFCAQEFEYTQDFVNLLSISAAQIGKRIAHVEVVSPLGWKTPFRLIKNKGRWRIAGYCVYQ